MARPAAPSMEVFESYFQRADLDRDGRISGAEAVAFFRGSNLPNQTLAQIWTFADTNNSGFLGRPEFYNALRLVTVAQSGREMTPELVKAALYGPAAAKIPAPQINPVAGPASQLNPARPPTGAASSASSIGSTGLQGSPSANMSQQFFSPPSSQYIGQPQTMPRGQASYPGFLGAGSVSVPRLPNSNTPSMPANLPVARPTGAPHGFPSQAAHVGSSTPSVISDGQGFLLAGSTPLGQLDQKTSSGLGSALVSQSLSDTNKSLRPVISNSLSVTSSFGGDVFSALSQQQKQSATTPTFSSVSVSTSASMTNATAPQPQPLVKQSQPDPFASMASLPNNSSQQLGLGMNSGQVGIGHSDTGSVSSPASVGSSVNPSSPVWPRMTPSNVQKYSNVFQKVDTDRDGKITGEEARGLFLSWRLPREVLKQVWDLSDQDNDSMLSFREFCIALYLMERSREGCSLPNTLPDSVKLDPLLPPVSLATTAYGGGTWRMVSGISAGRPPLPGTKPLAQPSGPRQSGVVTSQQRLRGPSLGVNNLHKDDHGTLNSKFQEANDLGNKIEAQKEILYSKEKIEYYRMKMQDLVLYKSRCDNRLNEITERVSSDRREVEALGKRYEEKYKQVAEAASKLNIEEASFRDVQERKMELFNAIAKMDQGGTVDGLLQVRVDRICSDLEDLMKALSERCKKHSLNMRPTVLLELPFGWQPGIQGGGADWDEDWDKFEDEDLFNMKCNTGLEGRQYGSEIGSMYIMTWPDASQSSGENKSTYHYDSAFGMKPAYMDGFAIVKELSVDVPTVNAPEKPKSNLVWHDKTPVDVKSDKSSHPSSPKEDIKKESTIEVSEEKSTLGSPSHGNARDFLNTDREDATFFSPRGLDNHSDNGTTQATSLDTFPAGNWPNFDGNDDTESVWGFNSKEPETDGSKDNTFFSSNDLGLNPIRTKSSPRANNTYQTRNSVFADSVPGTPFFNSNSPSRMSQMSEELSFDSFSRFDSFNMHDNGLFAPRETLARFDSRQSSSDLGGFARFDSMRSSRDIGDFKSFDDYDPFGSIGPFKSLESETPKYSDPFGSSGTFKSFDETPKHSDPFGMNSPFKSFDGETPRRISDNWSAF